MSMKKLHRHSSVSRLPTRNSVANLIADFRSVGSPNGLGAAYLLLQLKAQLGDAKTITKIKIWRSEDENHDEASIIFYVGNAKPENTPRSAQRSAQAVNGDVESRVVEKRADGRSFLREHWFLARL